MENSERELRVIDALERIANALEKIGGEDGLLDVMDTRLADIEYHLSEIKAKT